MLRQAKVGQSSKDLQVKASLAMMKVTWANNKEIKKAMLKWLDSTCSWNKEIMRLLSYSITWTSKKSKAPTKEFLCIALTKARALKKAKTWAPRATNQRETHCTKWCNQAAKSQSITKLLLKREWTSIWLRAQWRPQSLTSTKWTT